VPNPRGLSATLLQIGRVPASILGVVALWWAGAHLAGVNPLLLPSPPMVLEAFRSLWADGTLASDLRVSLGRAAAGFALGASLGVAVGILTARTRLIGHAVTPALSLLRPIPAIALVPLAIVWFGIGEGSKVFVIAYTVFLAVWLSTHHGTATVAETYIRASRSLGAGTWREFFEVVMPAAAPHIVAGLRMGAALAFLSLVAAELTGASSGIGFRIQEARQFMQTDVMFANLILLGVLGATLDAIFATLGRRLVHWEQL
jgi:NitT/TauT family transport system permease protein